MESASNGASEAKDQLTDDERKDQRERDSLKLSRAYVVHQIEASTNERYTETLRQALREIDQKLATLKPAH